MNRGQETRLRLLESESSAGRVFMLWDGRDYGSPFDIEGETERLRRGEGLTDADQVIVVRWRGPGEGDAA
jgi:hypothetical protein